MQIAQKKEGMNNMNVAIIGTGAYGLALALSFYENKNKIKMWTKFEEEKQELLVYHENKNVLPNVQIPEKIEITTDLKYCIEKSNLIVLAIPAGFVDSTMQLLAPHIEDQVLCIATKGIEQDTCLFINDVVEKYIKIEKLAVISGPSFAIDITSKMPIGLTLATKNKEAKEVIKKALANDHIKLRITDDIYGTEICGAIKNVIAIAAGMLEGMGANESTKAMFITESLHDIKELIKNLGGDGNTILSFAGFGDLLLTCTSTKSRNYSFGKLLSSGTQQEIDAYIQSHTIEGLYTLKSIYKLINHKSVDMPIVDLIYDIVFHQKEAKELLKFLIEKE